MLPYEDEIRAEIEKKYEPELRLAHDLHSHAVDALIDSWVIVHEPTFRQTKVMTLALALYTKICKSYRSILLLCERGFSEDADTITRTLFEAVLAFCFVMQRRFTLKENGKPLPLVPGKRLTAGFRTLLYFAHVAFDDERTLQAYAQRHGLKRAAKRLLKTDPLATAEGFAKMIGAHWTARLKQRRSYSGLSIKHLAESLGLGTYYDSVYRFQSSAVHSADACRFFEIAQGALILELGPSAAQATRPLETASSLVGMCMHVLNNRLRLGLEDKLAEFLSGIRATG